MEMYFNDFVQLPESALIFKVFCFFFKQSLCAEKFQYSHFPARRI